MNQVGYGASGPGSDVRVVHTNAHSYSVSIRRCMFYRGARANGFLKYPHFGNGHRTDSTDAPKANGVLMVL